MAGVWELAMVILRIILSTVNISTRNQKKYLSNSCTRMVAILRDLKVYPASLTLKISATRERHFSSYRIKNIKI
jgi:hypothetical protein